MPNYVLLKPKHLRGDMPDRHVKLSGYDGIFCIALAWHTGMADRFETLNSFSNHGALDSVGWSVG